MRKQSWLTGNSGNAEEEGYFFDKEIWVSIFKHSFLVRKKDGGERPFISLKEVNKLFRSAFNSKNIYEFNENTKFSHAKTLHQDHNLLRQYACYGGHPKWAFNGSG